MKIDREQWGRLSALLDAALDIDASERDAWLQALPSDAEPLKDLLRMLLAQRTRVETGDFLKTPDFVAAFRSEIARAQSAPVELLAGSEVGAYRLLRELGRGGMGSVWLAERIDGKLKRQVALKFPYAGPHQRQLAERLARERDILSSLEHPNIARLYDADVTPLGQPFLVLEYVDGIPINDYCDQQRLTIRERLVLFLQVLNAVQYAHSHLVVHRDLKPSNIFITGDRVVRLLDFGIAKLITEGEAKESAMTLLGGRALSPDYASPEQISGQPITTATDVYSLGVVLYELLSGARPYRLKRDSRASLEDAILAAEVIAPSRAAQEGSSAATTDAAALKGDLDAIVLKALQKDEARRYAGADAFRSDIECHLDGRAVLAQPDSAWYRLRKFTKRNRTAVAASILIFLALAGGLVAAVWQGQVASREAEKSAAINKFLLDVFSGADIRAGTQKPPGQMTVTELLDTSSAQMMESFDRQAEVKLDLIRLVAGIYGMMGEVEKSTALYRQGVDYSVRKWGPNNQVKAWMLFGIANDQVFAGHFKAAEPLLAEAEAAFKASGDDRSADYASLLKVKGNLLRRNGPQSEVEAKKILQQAAALFAKHYPEDSNYSGTLLYLAQLHLALGEDEDAERVAARAVAAAQAAGARRQELANTFSVRASIRQQLGKYVAAEEDYGAATTLYGQSVGPHHFLYLQNESLRGESLQLSGRRAEGLALLESTSAEITAIRPGSNTHANALRRLAQAQARDGSFDQAIETAAQVVSIGRLQQQPFMIATALLDQAEAMTALEQYDNAAARVAEALEASPPRVDSPNPTGARGYYVQSALALEQGKLAAASEFARLSHAATKVGLAERTRHTRLYVLESQIALARSDIHMAENRIQLAQKALAAEGANVDPFTRAKVLSMQGLVLCRAGKPTEGRSTLAEAISLQERIQDPAARPLAKLKTELANCRG